MQSTAPTHNVDRAGGKHALFRMFHVSTNEISLFVVLVSLWPHNQIGKGKNVENEEKEPSQKKPVK